MILFNIIISDPSPVESSSSDSTCSGCKTLTSTIKFRPTAQDNQASFGCKARHPALKRSSPLRTQGTNVILSVLCKYMRQLPPHRKPHIFNLNHMSKYISDICSHH